MKLLKLIPIILFLLLTSCKNDDNNTNTTDLLVGVWKIEKEVTICDNGNTVEALVGCSNGFYDSISDFTIDGKIIHKLYGGSNCELNLTEIGSWEITNNKLYIDWDGNGDDYYLEEIEYFIISENRMKIGYYAEESDACQFTKALEYNEYIKQ